MTNAEGGPQPNKIRKGIAAALLAALAVGGALGATADPVEESWGGNQAEVFGSWTATWS